MTPTTRNYCHFTVLVILLFSTLTAAAQQLGFVLLESGYPISPDRCLSKDISYESLSISPIGDDLSSLKDATLTIALGEEMLFYESTIEGKKVCHCQC